MERLIPILLILLLLCPTTQTKAQQSIDTSFVHAIFNKQKNSTIDTLDNDFIWNKLQNKLYQINTSGTIIQQVELSNKLGRIEHIDSNNPFRILVFYASFGTIHLLNKNLSAQKTIYVNQLHLSNNIVIALSQDNYFWVFDRQANKIKKIDDQGNILLESIDFSQLAIPSITVNKLYERKGMLYIFDYTKKCLVLDIYGNYKSFIEQ